MCKFAIINIIKDDNSCIIILDERYIEINRIVRNQGILNKHMYFPLLLSLLI